jgi:pyrimidine-nucleoside phosphorylase
MRAVDIIMKKRDGGELNRQEIEFLIGGYTNGSIPDYQVSAWTMAVFFSGMSARETADLTDCMLRSGAVMDLSGIAGPFIDKHSTGGVGDKTSLILAPLAAALGLKVPMMSGRALGHTGGTLDKLESVRGFKTGLSQAEFREYLAADGFAMTGQTKETVPADRLLYALRDVTATVESIPLITASILSKKVAEGAEGLVFDVKTGNGAFMKDVASSEALARSLVDTGKAMGKRIIALITDMNQPLGNMVGNFLEVEESLDCLEGSGPGDLMEVTLELCARMLLLAKKAETTEEALERCKSALASGQPRELFMRNIKRQGGDPAWLEASRGTWRAPCSRDLKASCDGYLSEFSAWQTGLAGVYLGVGRNRTEDAVSPLAGLQLFAKRGHQVHTGQTLATVWADSEAQLDSAWPLLEQAAMISNAAPEPRPLIYKELL